MQPLEPDDPREVGDYRLLGRLGAGGMGRVYLGRTAGGRTVAVKTVRRELAVDARFRARFRQEVDAARKVGGEWTAPVLDADTESAQPWVATGYVAGPSLGAAVREFGPLPEPTVRALGVGLAEALAHVHGLGLVHRDVKPSNVLLTLDGPRLIDFGITRALDGTSSLTGTGNAIGSPGFMSPEQARGEKVGAATDVFSLGAVLAYAASGTLPFGREAVPAVMVYRMVYEYPELSGTSESLRWILLDCLAKDPDARPTPRRLGAWLDDDRTVAARLEQGEWLPAGLAAAVGRSAVQLLDLDAEGGPAGSAAGGPVPPRPAGRPSAGKRSAGAAAAPPTSPPPPLRPSAPPKPSSAPSSAPPNASSFVPPSAGAAAPPGFGPPPRTVPMRGPRRGRRRRWVVPVVVLVVLVVLALAVVGTVFLRFLAAEADRTTASGDHTAPPLVAPLVAPTVPGAVGRNLVPAAFLGTWRGDVSVVGGGVIGVITVAVGQGGIGDESTTTRIDGPTGPVCEGAWTLRLVSATKVVYTSRLVATSSAGACQNVAVPRMLTLLPDGTLRYDITDGTTTTQAGVLRKAG
ncbi:MULTISPECIES: serine/threonine-protein kinase [unclassified Kitasatospora]|uniref:serine/threonine-protein kinase n=1 Tax=unclassified Kitasatospora TaxID=2633591 RepID=UPI00340A5E2A